MKHNYEKLRIAIAGLGFGKKVHLEALGSVNRDMGIKYFRRCGIPGANKLMTTEEKSNLDNELAIVIIILMVLYGYVN